MTQAMELVPVDIWGFSLGFIQLLELTFQFPSRSFKTACSAPGLPNSLALAIWAFISSDISGAFLSAFLSAARTGAISDTDRANPNITALNFFAFIPSSFWLLRMLGLKIQRFIFF